MDTLEGDNTEKTEVCENEAVKVVNDLAQAQTDELFIEVLKLIEKLKEEYKLPPLWESDLAYFGASLYSVKADDRMVIFYLPKDKQVSECIETKEKLVFKEFSKPE